MFFRMKNFVFMGVLVLFLLIGCSKENNLFSLKKSTLESKQYEDAKDLPDILEIGRKIAENGSGSITFLKDNYDSVVYLSWGMAEALPEIYQNLNSYFEKSEKVSVAELIRKSKIGRKIATKMGLSLEEAKNFVENIRPTPFLLLINTKKLEDGLNTSVFVSPPYPGINYGVTFSSSGIFSVTNGPSFLPLVVVTPEPGAKLYEGENSDNFQERTKSAGVTMYVKEFTIYTAGDPWWDPKPEIYTRVDMVSGNYSRVDFPGVDQNYYKYIFTYPGIAIAWEYFGGDQWYVMAVCDDDSWWKEWGSDDLLGTLYLYGGYIPSGNCYLYNNGTLGAKLYINSLYFNY